MVVEFVALAVLFGLVGALGLIGTATYRADPKGWQMTVKRLSRTIRAHVESGKPAKQIEKVKPAEIEEWDAQFHGKPKAIAPVVFEHKIVEKWFATKAGTYYPHWKCSCGHTNWHIDESSANRKAREHMDNFNKAEKAKASGSKLQW